MRFTIKNFYYKEYMSDYYKQNKKDRIEYQLNYYYKNKEKIRKKQNIYYKNVYYPKNKTRSKIKPCCGLIIERNIRVIF
jgi:hypothetical protein